MFLRSIITAVFLLLFAIVAAADPVIFEGTVKNEKGDALAGATVVLNGGTGIIASAVTDNHGYYRLTADPVSKKELIITVSLIGYYRQVEMVGTGNPRGVLDFRLKQKPIKMRDLTVKPSGRETGAGRHYSHRQIIIASHKTLFSANPISIIKAPQVVRQGSSHSSRIRVNGTSPRYYINGIDIGHDNFLQ